MHYLSSVYWITTPLHVSGLLVVHHQEVAMYICDNWYVLYVLVDCRRPADSRLKINSASGCFITRTFRDARSTKQNIYSVSVRYSPILKKVNRNEFRSLWNDLPVMDRSTAMPSAIILNWRSAAEFVGARDKYGVTDDNNIRWCAW
jgi:hypothetical protein